MHRASCADPHPHLNKTARGADPQGMSEPDPDINPAPNVGPNETSNVGPDETSNVGPDDIQALPADPGAPSPAQTIEPEDAEANPARAYSPYADDEDENPENNVGAEVQD